MNSRQKSCLKAILLLDAARDKELKPIPPKWFTRADYEEASGLSTPQAGKKIRDGLRDGLLITKKWRVKSGWVPIYRVK